MNPKKREQIFAYWKAANPSPKTELRYNSPFELLISVLLSAQATDISVNNATKGLYAEANTPAKMLGLGEARVRHHIRTIGLFNTKAKNVIKTCQILHDQHDGVVPDNRESLEALPGVGRKTANVVLNTAFRQIAMAVDTHIFRVSNRTGLAPGKDVVEVEQKLLKFVPADYLLDAHHWLILHGRYVCVARKPKCGDCGIADLCEFKQKTTAEPTGKNTASSKNKRKKRVSAIRSTRSRSLGSISTGSSSLGSRSSGDSLTGISSSGSSSPGNSSSRSSQSSGSSAKTKKKVQRKKLANKVLLADSKQIDVKTQLADKKQSAAKLVLVDKKKTGGKLKPSNKKR